MKLQLEFVLGNEVFSLLLLIVTNLEVEREMRAVRNVGCRPQNCGMC